MACSAVVLASRGRGMVTVRAQAGKNLASSRLGHSLTIGSTRSAVKASSTGSTGSNSLASSRMGHSLTIGSGRPSIRTSGGGSTSGNSLSSGRLGNSLAIGSIRSQSPRPRAAAGGSETGNSLSMGRDGGALSIGSQRSGGGGGSAGGGGGSGKGGSSGNGGDDAAHPMRLWTFLFAAVLAAGGAVAFFKKGSGKSLGASLSASLILVLCARSMVGASAAGAARVAFGLTLLLGITMVNRFTKTKKVMPAGLVAGSSLGMAMGYLLAGL